MSKLKAYKAGYVRGASVGTWVVDGNTTVEAAKRLLDGIADGDPAVMDMQPAPLSGEWAGESIPELSYQYNIDLENEDNADSFEAGYSEGYWTEVQRSAEMVIDAIPWS